MACVSVSPVTASDIAEVIARPDRMFSHDVHILLGEAENTNAGADRVRPSCKESR
jgi:hypothetical protein